MGSGGDPPGILSGDAMAVIADRPFLISHRARIVSFAAQQRLPTIYSFREFVEEGGLMVYGAELCRDVSRRHLCGQNPERC
jgi:hypothetical protein